MNHCIESVSSSQVVIAPSSGEAEFLRHAASSEHRRVRCRHSMFPQAGDGQCERLCEVIAQQRAGFRRDLLQAN